MDIMTNEEFSNLTLEEGKEYLRTVIEQLPDQCLKELYAVLKEGENLSDEELEKYLDEELKKVERQGD